MVATLEFTESELRTATGVARRITRIQRGLLEYDDIHSECLMWMCANPKHITRWREEGKAGKAKLGTALYRAAMRWATKQRAITTNTQVQDHSFYSEAVLVEILPDIYDYESWSLESRGDDGSGVRSPSRPGEGNTRLAMLVDVKSAVHSLSAEDQALLRERFADGGVDVSVLAIHYETHETTIRRRLTNVLRKLADRLGGEPPWF